MNQSGIYPLLDRVLVQPDEIEEKTEGGIIIADTTKEAHQSAQAIGTFIAAGPDAFINTTTHVYTGSDMRLSEIRVEGWNREKAPKPGDKVLFAKYGGLVNIGKDGKEYRVLNDRDLTCIVEEGVRYTGIQSRKRMQQ